MLLCCNIKQMFRLCLVSSFDLTWWNTNHTESYKIESDYCEDSNDFEKKMSLKRVVSAMLGVIMNPIRNIIGDASKTKSDPFKK